ncbi:TolC family protein [bacterium]
MVEQFLSINPQIQKEIERNRLVNTNLRSIEYCVSAQDNTPSNASWYKLQLKKIKSDYYPTLSFSASNSWAGDANVFDESSWRLGLNMGFSIFSGFSTKTQVKQAKLNINLRGNHILISFDSKGELVKDSSNMPEIRICNFEFF